MEMSLEWDRNKKTKKPNQINGQHVIHSCVCVCVAIVANVFMNLF